ncbi:DUF4446 family protein [Patescibacteria group bacterium]|nr:DUF4446 family protein [Patescibacteria group bacterium]
MQTPISTEEIIIYALVAVVTILIIWILRLESKIKNIPSIKNTQNVNSQISVLQKNIIEFEEFKNQTNSNIVSINNNLKKTVKGIETIRFNPFKDGSVGGNQSFATAIIDDHGNGVIISSLYSRERVSVFAKPIENWICEYEMSGEEKEVLQKAKEKKFK